MAKIADFGLHKVKEATEIMPAWVKKSFLPTHLVAVTDFKMLSLTVTNKLALALARKASRPLGNISVHTSSSFLFYD